MRQHFIGLAGVHHASNQAQLQTSEHSYYNFRPVFDIDRDSITFHQATRFKIMGKLVDPLIQFGPTYTLVLIANSGLITQGQSIVFQAITNRTLVGHLRRQRQF